MIPGHEAWVTRDYGGEGKALSMSKALLGDFVFHLLQQNGEILGTWAIRPQHQRSYVQMSISLPPGCKEKLEELTGVALEKPAKIKLA